jgi:hypothetical protein
MNRRNKKGRKYYIAPNVSKLQFRDSKSSSGTFYRRERALHTSQKSTESNIQQQGVSSSNILNNKKGKVTLTQVSLAADRKILPKIQITLGIQGNFLMCHFNGRTQSCTCHPYSYPRPYPLAYSWTPPRVGTSGPSPPVTATPAIHDDHS